MIHSHAIVVLGYYRKVGQKGSVRDTIALVEEILCQRMTQQHPPRRPLPRHISKRNRNLTQSPVLPHGRRGSSTGWKGGISLIPAWENRFSTKFSEGGQFQVHVSYTESSQPLAERPSTVRKNHSLLFFRDFGQGGPFSTIFPKEDNFRSIPFPPVFRNFGQGGSISAIFPKQDQIPLGNR